MNGSVGLIAHASSEDSVDTMERDMIALGTALIRHGHSLLLHAGDSLALPLLLAASSHRAPIVLEGAERAPRPIVMMPMKPVGIGELPDAAFRAPVTVGSTAAVESRKEEPMSVSLLDQLSALGVVDRKWMDRQDANMFEIFETERPSAIVCMGWADEMGDIVKSAESYANKIRSRLVVAGPRRGSMIKSETWIDLQSFLEIDIPKIPRPKPEEPTVERRGLAGEQSEEYFEAWEYATDRAAMVTMADSLARRLSG